MIPTTFAWFQKFKLQHFLFLIWVFLLLVVIQSFIQYSKFRPIISQIGTYTNNAGKVIAEHLKPLCSNQYKIWDTQEFASHIKNYDEEYVSYDVDSLFTNIPAAETIKHIIHQIYIEKQFHQYAISLFLNVHYYN